MTFGESLCEKTAYDTTLLSFTAPSLHFQERDFLRYDINKHIGIQFEGIGVVRDITFVGVVIATGRSPLLSTRAMKASAFRDISADTSKRLERDGGAAVHPQRKPVGRPQRDGGLDCGEKAIVKSLLFIDDESVVLGKLDEVYNIVNVELLLDGGKLSVDRSFAH
jgi:hypothetical protein